MRRPSGPQGSRPPNGVRIRPPASVDRSALRVVWARVPRTGSAECQCHVQIFIFPRAPAKCTGPADGAMVARGRRRAIGPERGSGRLEEAERCGNGQRLWAVRHCSRCSRRCTAGPPRRRCPSRGSVGGHAATRSSRAWRPAAAPGRAGRASSGAARARVSRPARARPTRTVTAGQTQVVGVDGTGQPRRPRPAPRRPR